jgi:hypothetical protein
MRGDCTVANFSLSVPQHSALDYQSHCESWMLPVMSDFLWFVDKRHCNFTALLFAASELCSTVFR